MQTVNDFYKLRDTEDFFDFFGLERVWNFD